MSLKRTSLYENQEKLGAKFVDFGGWELPVFYSSLKEEHNTVRNKAGLFDVSHMGELLVNGADAKKFIQKTTCRDLSNLIIGKAYYSAILNENGGYVDDILIYPKSENEFLICVNASNREKDYNWLQKQSKGFDVKLEDASNNWVQIAIQGPESDKYLNKILQNPLKTLKYYTFYFDKYDTMDIIVSRTGYTGEYGYELYLPVEIGSKIWDELIELGLKPCGLGARDTLRLEAGCPLYGHEMSDTISPLEVGPKWLVGDTKLGYIGADEVSKMSVNLSKKLVGIEMIDKGIPRDGYLLFDINENEVGVVTSGTASPTLGLGIGMAFLPLEVKTGDELLVDIRGKKRKAKVVTLPFVSGTARR